MAFEPGALLALIVTSSYSPAGDNLPHRFLRVFWSMRGLAILIVALVALSAMASPQPRHFTPRPTGPMPAANVPFWPKLPART